MDLFFLRGRIRRGLADTGADIWATDDVDEAIRQAIDEYSRTRPLHSITTLTVSAGTRELDVSAISNLLGVDRVWYPYTAVSPEHPPPWRNSEYWRDAGLLYFPDEGELSAGDVVRIFYSTLQTLSGLDGATATTIPVEDELLLIKGAAGFAATGRSVDLMEQVTHDRLMPQQVRAWGLSKLQEFRAGLNTLARRLALEGSAFVELPGLDKWDGEWS